MVQDTGYFEGTVHKVISEKKKRLEQARLVFLAKHLSREENNCCL